LEAGPTVPLSPSNSEADPVCEASAAAPAVEEGGVQELGTEVCSRLSSIGLSFTTLHEGVDPVLVEEIMTSIVLADIAGHRQVVL
jgi:hypothetical protein